MERTSVDAITSPVRVFGDYVGYMKMVHLLFIIIDTVGKERVYVITRLNI